MFHGERERQPLLLDEPVPAVGAEDLAGDPALTLETAGMEEARTHAAAQVLARGRETGNRRS